MLLIIKKYSGRDERPCPDLSKDSRTRRELIKKIYAREKEGDV